jgi:hypothetical protein
MHPSHAAFTCREVHRQELLSLAEQQALVRRACTGTVCTMPILSTAAAIRAFAQRLAATPLARARACPEAASLASESPIPSIVP